ncbi:hypothetical protein, partial [Bacteroides heparinolyticus]|uniref:hypothetical protein n=1 Tax=Prevotella heparinolytica TaxID=28113 RepID=UPI0035A0221E
KSITYIHNAYLTDRWEQVANGLAIIRRKYHFHPSALVKSSLLRQRDSLFPLLIVSIVFLIPEQRYAGLCAKILDNAIYWFGISILFFCTCLSLSMRKTIKQSYHEKNTPLIVLSGDVCNRKFGTMEAGG